MLDKRYAICECACSSNVKIIFSEIKELFEFHLRHEDGTPIYEIENMSVEEIVRKIVIMDINFMSISKENVIILFLKLKKMVVHGKGKHHLKI